MGVRKADANRLLFAVDIAGTLVFAIEGATAAMKGNLDLLGLMVLAFATALGGGIIRDVLIGDVPPASLRDWHYAAVAFAGGATVFFLHSFVQSVPAGVILILDAAGLALFAIAGTQKALVFGMHPFVAILLGTITGVGGGTVRDVLLAQVPGVLRADVYATAALAGSEAMIAISTAKLPRAWAAGSVLFAEGRECLAALEFAADNGVNPVSALVARGSAAQDQAFQFESESPFPKNDLVLRWGRPILLNIESRNPRNQACSTQESPSDCPLRMSEENREGSKLILNVGHFFTSGRSFFYSQRTTCW